MNNKLHRSHDKVLAGVCGGFAERYGWDATLIRILYAAAMVFTGFFPLGLIYIIAGHGDARSRCLIK